MVSQLVRITHGYAFDEGHLGSAIVKVRQLLGSGPVERRGETLQVISLARWIALAALIPLGFILWRRSLI